MMKLRKKVLGLAVAAAAMAGGVSIAQAQTVAANGLGQVLIYPYLTAKSDLNAKSDWSSFLHVINTSSTQTVAAKVRFRTATDSTDAYDFIVVLSPNDVWTGVVEASGGKYGFRPTDNTCTVPYFGKDKFQPFIIQSAEVYAEVIMMGVSTNGLPTDTPIAVAAKHDKTTGMPKDCAVVEAAFGNATAVQAATEFNGSLNDTSALNILTGKFDLVNVTKGWSGASRAVAIANFGAPTAAGTDTGPYFGNTNMWSQSGSDFDHPTLAEGASGLTGLNTVLNKTALINEWVLNPNLGELSSWIVTFPTKKLTVDAITAVNALSGQVTKLSLFGNSTTCTNGVVVAPSLFNREEKQLISASPGTTPLCNEANVISFKNGAIDSSTVLNSNVNSVITTDLFSMGVLAGWMQLGMPNTSVLHTFAPTQTTLPGWTPTVPVTAGTVNGRPVVGFNLTARATPSDTVIYDHAYLP